MKEKADIISAITLRPVSDDDHDLLLRIYAASREIELSMVPWDAEVKRTFIEHQLNAQTAYYREHYADATHDLILLNGKPAGRLYVDRRPETIAILDITVLPEYRKRGIGTTLIKQLRDEAGASGRRVTVYIETFNPSQKLFRDLGFDAIAEEGVNLKFEWKSGSTK